jgi:hypothetical protein
LGDHFISSASIASGCDDVARNTKFALAAIAQDFRLLRADQHL